MYRRYSTDYRSADSFADGGRTTQPPSGNGHCEKPQQHNCDRPHTNPQQANRSRQPDSKKPQGRHTCGEDGRDSGFSLLKFIPQSIYNPETGKVFGFMSAEDLLLAALILVLLDNKCEDEDNSMLIYALLYILLSDHINLPI